MIRYPYRKHSKKSGADKKIGNSNSGSSSRSLKIETNVETNLQQIKELTSDSPDFMVRHFALGLKANVPAAVVFLDSMVKTDTVNELVMKSLLSRPFAEVAAEEESADGLYKRIQGHALSLGEVKDCDDWNTMMEHLLMGDTIILLEGCEKAISCGTHGGEVRAVNEPTTQSVVRGSKDGFVESLFTNVSLVRRRIKSSDLTLEIFKVGSTSLTNVAMLYMKDIADQSVVKEVRRRVESINIDAIFESGMVEEMIQDHNPSSFVKKRLSCQCCGYYFCAAGRHSLFLDCVDKCAGSRRRFVPASNIPAAHDDRQGGNNGFYRQAECDWRYDRYHCRLF
ncbi:hypothetical protein E0698_15580 [Paenibacillus sp. 23TSA30-6]|nr:hypothetical protein [Paenibacillus sp. 23TSA30-6]